MFFIMTITDKQIKYFRVVINVHFVRIARSSTMPVMCAQMTSNILIINQCNKERRGQKIITNRMIRSHSIDNVYTVLEFEETHAIFDFVRNLILSF